MHTIKHTSNSCHLFGEDREMAGLLQCRDDELSDGAALKLRPLDALVAPGVVSGACHVDQAPSCNCHRRQQARSTGELVRKDSPPVDLLQRGLFGK